MANDNDKKSLESLLNSISNRKPNSLDRIGAEDYTAPYSRLLHSKQERGRETTADQIRLENEKRDLQDKINILSSRHEDLQSGTPSERLSIRDIKNLDLSDTTIKHLKKYSSERQIYNIAYSSWNAYTSDRMREINTKIGQREDLTKQVAHKAFVRKNLTYAESETGLTTLSEEPNVKMAAQSFSTMGEANIRNRLKQIKEIKYQASYAHEKATKNIDEPNGEGAYLASAQYLEEVKREQAALQSALKIKRRQGSDISGTISTAESIAAKFKKEKEYSLITSNISSGKVGSIQEERKALDDLKEKLYELAQSISKAGEAADEFSGDLSELNEEYEKQKQKVKQMEEGGGGGRRFNKLMMGFDAARAAIGVGSYYAVGSEMEQMNLRTGAAQFANQRYSDQFAATQGDMAALRRVTSMQQDIAAGYGSTMGNRALMAAGAGTAVDATSALLKGTVIARTGGVAAPLLFNSMLGDATSAANAGIRIGSGITFAEQQQMSANQRMQLMDTVNAIPDQTRQAFYNYRMSAYENLRGAGSKLSDIYGVATSRDMRKQLEGFGFGSEEGAALFGVGARAIGSQFVNSKDRGASVVTKAAQLQQLGIMGAEEYMGRVGQITATGGGDKDLEDIMAAAVERGVNDAKSLSGMIESVTALSRDAAAKGVGISPIIGAQMAFGMQQLSGSGRDESLKQAMIASDIARASQLTSTTGIDFPTMSLMAGLGKTLPGASGLQRSKIAETPIEVLSTQVKELSKFKKGDKIPNEIIASLKAPSAFVDDQGRYLGEDVTKKVVAEKAINQITGRARGIAPTGLINEVESAIRGGKSLQDLSPAAIKMINETTGMSAAGLLSIGKEDFSGVATKGTGPLAGGAAYAAQSKIAGAQARGKQVTEAEEMGGGGDKLAQTMASLQSFVASSMSAIESAKDTAKAADTMKLSTTDFGNSVQKFSEAVSMFATTYGNNIGGTGQNQGQGRPMKNNQADSQSRIYNTLMQGIQAVK